MTPRSPPSLPLVWVTTGKTQHAAYLIESDDKQGQCWVQWASTHQIEQVSLEHVEKHLSPRRRKSPERLSFGHGDSNETPSKKTKKSLSAISSVVVTDTNNEPPLSLTKLGAMVSRRSPSLSAHSNGGKEYHDICSPAMQKYSSQDQRTSPCVPLSEQKQPAREISIRKIAQVSTDEENCTDEREPLHRATHLSRSQDTIPIDPTVNTDDSSCALEKSRFPLVSSAYLQNLAEIAYTITQDARWRVQGEQSEPLLRWEDGVDLSAVTYLRRCYLPPSRRKRTAPCTCLLCRDSSTLLNKATARIETAEMKTSRSNDTPDIGRCSSDQDVRWLYLYCRLFYRRGPWFRLDDVYDRYYKPGRKYETTEKDDLEIGSDKSNTPSAAAKENMVQSQGGKTNQASSAARSVELDSSTLRQHLLCFNNMAADLHNLGQAGLIRGFQGEEECGKTVGVSILTSDMRATLLSRLGGGRKKQSSHRDAPRPLYPDNAIWRQMSEQKSIFASFVGGSEKLLPARKHVDDVIVDKLVVDILKSCCRLENAAFLPASIYKEHASRLKLKIFSILRRNGQIHYSCFRLREEPHLTFLRCCRLFLCATSGPGDMRSDETNGYKSVHVINANPPLHKRVRRPGIDTWCSVSYPGMLNRFGLASSFFIETYIPVDPSDERAPRIQVFSTRNHFFAWESTIELRVSVDYLLELTEVVRYEMRREERDNQKEGQGRWNSLSLDGDSVDYMGLLTKQGRSTLVKLLVDDAERESIISSSISLALDQISHLDMHEWERILFAVFSLCTSVLEDRHQTISEVELSFMEARPWLRHLWWEGCLAYILWDLIPFAERFGLYDWAVIALKLLLYGSAAEAAFSDQHRTPLAPLLLSRRARGKAYDRLIIDLSHLSKKQTGEKLSTKEKKKATKLRLDSHVKYVNKVLTNVVYSASVPFSAIRTLARRLKQPLAETMRSLPNLEAVELGLRLKSVEIGSDVAKAAGYSDWFPITDVALANNVSLPESGVGSRCVFVGHEDGSLNVEELAMECYNKGRLPLPGESQDSPLAGWEGWHDEGGHVRALFRIICGGPLLGMDWGCFHEGTVRILDQELVHLSPYQSSPFDLHVGFELSSSSDDSLSSFQPTQCFYARGRDRIELFLRKVAGLSRQEVCDVVFESVKARLLLAIETGRKDPTLERDLQNLRTLSLIAAGCGGKQLASVFRCLLFDYRHWSGGLPDLLLVRAIATNAGDDELSLVDLSVWVGESFSAEYRLSLQNQKGAAMLADKDEEFLGCSKVGDSGATQFKNSRRGLPQQSSTKATKVYSNYDLPGRLELVHEGVCVTPETMMVEVKSSNDRLDPRQEDWLNVLDLHGNARVCKFEDSQKFKRRAEKKTKKLEKDTNVGN